MKKSLVFGILLSICMTIPIMADTSNSGIVIEPISSLQEQLEEMTEEQKVIAIEKYYSVEDEKIVETRASRQSYLPNIEISDVAEESKNVDGNETFLLYEDQCIQDANPWNEESKVKELPVYYNASCYGEDEKVDNFNEDELKEQLKDMAEKFGIKYEDSKVKKQGGLDQEILEWIQEKEGGIANEYLYFNECSISEKGIQVIVKDNKDTVIIFSPSLVLEKCQKENEYDQIVLIAKQLQEMFPKICGVDKYQYDINGGDYTIDGRQKWRIAFVLKKESVEEKNIINYNYRL